MTHVLVVDDEEAVRQYLALVLPESGFAVTTAKDGESALESFRARPADVVVMDVQMPGLDGPATLQALRAIDPRIPCCFMSGDTGSYSLQHLMDHGAAFVAKPFKACEVVQMLLDLLTASRQLDGLHETSRGNGSLG